MSNLQLALVGGSKIDYLSTTQGIFNHDRLLNVTNSPNVSDINENDYNAYSNFFIDDTADGGILLKNFSQLAAVVMFITDSLFPRISILETIKPDIREESTTNKSIQAELVEWLRIHAGLTNTKIGDLVNVSRQTIQKWLNNEDIHDTNRQCLMDTVAVLKLAQKKYPTKQQLLQWLRTPITLEGESPFDLIQKKELDRARFFALARKPSRVRPLFINKNIPEEFKFTPESISEPFLEDENL